MAKLTDRTELTLPADGDLYVTTDVSDTTDAATGTDKKITWANLKAGFKTYFDTLYAGVLGADDNYVTDAEKTKLSNLSGTNTGDQTITNTSDGTSHTVTLSASGGSVQLIEGTNITLTTGGTGSAGTVTIAASGSSGDVTKVGTPVNNQVGVWTGDGTLEGPTTLTFNGDVLTVTNDTDAASNQVLVLQGDRATPSTNDTLYQSFLLSDSAGNQDEMARIETIATDVTSTSEDSLLGFYVRTAGTFARKIVLQGAALAPHSNDNIALGTASVSFSDLYLAEGGVINWDNGDATLTQVGDVVTLAGADLKVSSPGNVSTSVVTTDATQTLTNKTLTSPVLNTGVSGTAITDASGVNTGTSTTTLITPDALAGSYAGTKSLSVQVTDGTTDVATGDGKAYITIPEALNGMNLIRAQATVVTAGTTNATTVMIHNKTDAQDMLSGAISIASAGTVGTVGTINTTYDDVATNDILRIDVDSVSTTAPKGLMVVLEFRLP